jgi:tetratricopeptide (TPR) repeat protein
MPFSNSTLHWLDDGEESARHEPTDTPITVPGYDPTAPVAGRRRAVLVVGGAGDIALLVTGVLKVMAPHHDAAAEATAADPARELTVRAQAAFDAHHVGEALELARLALVADPRFADAHFVLANCDRAHNQVPAAREEYRRYLELAPLGTHAAAARDALASLPP